MRSHATAVRDAARKKCRSATTHAAVGDTGSAQAAEDMEDTDMTEITRPVGTRVRRTGVGGRGMGGRGVGERRATPRPRTSGLPALRVATRGVLGRTSLRTTSLGRRGIWGWI